MFARSPFPFPSCGFPLCFVTILEIVPFRPPSNFQTGSVTKCQTVNLRHVHSIKPFELGCRQTSKFDSLRLESLKFQALKLTTSRTQTPDLIDSSIDRALRLSNFVRSFEPEQFSKSRLDALETFELESPPRCVVSCAEGRS